MTPSLPPSPAPRRPPPRWLDTVILFGVIGLSLSVGAYSIAWFVFNSGPSAVKIQSVPIDVDANGLSKELAFSDAPVPVPDLSFTDGSGNKLSLAAYRGRPLVLNVWATWCVPCRKEMPSLDRLQAEFDPSKLLVLTLSIDLKGAPTVDAFYRELGLRSLGIYVDTSGSAASKLGMPGVPGTLLIDAQGREVGRKLGPAEWDSPEVVALIRKHLDLDGAETLPKGST